MATELERLQVVIEATTAPFKSAIDEVKSQVSRFQSEIKKNISGDTSLQIKPEVNTEEGMGKIEKLKLFMKSKIADMKVGTGLFDYSDEFKTIMNDAEQAEQRVRVLEIALENAKAQEGPDSGAYQHFNSELDQARQRVTELGAAAVNAVRGGSITVFKGFSNALKGISSHALSAAKSLGQLAANGIDKAGGAFGALIKKMFSANSLLSRFRSGTKGVGISTDSLSGIFKKMLRYGFGIRSLYALVNKLRNTVITGLKNMAKAMPTSEIARNINTVQSSFSQLKASVAAAAAPLFNALAPALNSVIQIAIKAANAVGMLIAAMTGKKFTAATAGASDTAKSVSNVGSAADDANESAKKLKRTLMGFDQINKLDDNDDSSSSGGSGGGSGGNGGGINYGSYEDMPISQNIKDFVDKIKDAWKDADFTDIGRMVGEKLNDALENIPWDKIKETARKIAKSLATFLNGFIEAVNWELVGKTFAEGLNTVIEFAYTFITTFKWDKFGEAIGRAINGFVDNLDTEKLKETGTALGKGIADALNGALEKTNWTKVGNTLGDGINAVINTGHSFVTTFNWKKFGSSVADLLNGTIDKIDWSKAGETLSEGIKGILDAAITAIENVDWEKFGNNVGKFLSSIDWAGILFKVGILICDAFMAAVDFGKGLLDSIVDGLKNADWGKIAKQAWDLLEKAWTTLKKAVEINITLLKKGWDTIGKFVGDAVSVAVSLAKKAWTTITAFVGDKVEAAVGLVKDGWKSITAFVGDKVEAAVSLAKKGWKSISSFVGSAVKVSIALAKKKWKSITSFVGNNVKAFVRLEKRGWSNIASYVGKLVDVGIKLGKKGWKTLSGWIGTLVKVGIKLGKEKWKSLSDFIGKSVTVAVKLTKGWVGSGLSWLKKVAGFAEGGIYYGGSWHPVTAAAGGGSFDQGQMFIAREAGPELVGTIGGHTAVMNNNQIVSSVAAGVYHAVLAAMSANTGNGQTEVHIHLEGDAKKLFKVIQTEAEDYTGSTGLAPFPL